MGFELTTLVVIGTGCTCCCKSNYHTITMAPEIKNKIQFKFNRSIAQNIHTYTLHINQCNINYTSIHPSTYIFKGDNTESCNQNRKGEIIKKKNVKTSFVCYGKGIWGLKLLSTIFQLYRGSQFLLVEETGENQQPFASH